MKILFFFIDGIGLGADDPQTNPFARFDLPNLKSLLGGRKLVLDSIPLETGRATLLALDACLGVEGMPQSATGQAALLTGINIPRALGYHYGPKPNPAVAEFLNNGNLFKTLRRAGKKATLLNAYPSRYFEGIQNGRRLLSAIPLAVTSAGILLKTADDLHAGQALSADFTAESWHKHLGLHDTPILPPREAGLRLASLAQKYDFSFFEYWLSDYAGHGQDMAWSQELLDDLDQALGGLLEAWEDENGLVLITSDHGNLEDMSTHGHTFNMVPALVIGAPEQRREFVEDMRDLTDVAPAIRKMLLKVVLLEKHF